MKCRLFDGAVSGFRIRIIQSDRKMRRMPSQRVQYGNPDYVRAFHLNRLQPLRDDLDRNHVISRKYHG